MQPFPASARPLAALLLTALAAAMLSAAPQPWKPAPDSVALSTLGLDSAEKAWIQARLGSGTPLRVAARERPDSYETGADGSVKGFDYNLVREFAGTLGLSLEFTVEKTIDAFFTKDGAMPADLGAPGSTYDYTPDLLRKVDLYTTSLGITPWRTKLMSMTPIFPTRSQLAGRKGGVVRSFADLQGKRFAVIKDSIQQRNLANMAAAKGLSISFVFGADEAELFRLVSTGRADYLLDASVIFAKNSRLLAGLDLFPYPEDIVMTGWATKKEDRILQSILIKFLAASQKTGIFGRLWTEVYSMDFTAYLAAVLSSPETPLK